MKRKLKSILLSAILILLTIIVAPFNGSIIAEADETPTQVTEGLYYIKNRLSGQYLAVKNGDISGNLPVVQVKHNNGSVASKTWRIRQSSNGVYEIITQVGSATKTLSVDTDSIADAYGRNLALIAADPTAGNNKFQFYVTANNTYKIATHASNYDQVLVVEQASCAEYKNVIQFRYNGSKNDEWILEPCTGNYNPNLAVQYAKANAHSHVDAYPRYNGTADSVNYVSQCLLAGGIHFEDSWFIYRKDTYSDPAATGLDFTRDWQITNISPYNSSPWLEGFAFWDFWSTRVNTYDWYTPAEVLNQTASELYGVGDVVMFFTEDSVENKIEYVFIITKMENGILYLTDHAGHVDYSINDAMSIYSVGLSEVVFLDFT